MIEHARFRPNRQPIEVGDRIGRIEVEDADHPERRRAVMPNADGGRPIDAAIGWRTKSESAFRVAIERVNDAVRHGEADAMTRVGQDGAPGPRVGGPARIQMPVRGGAMTSVAADKVGDDDEIAVADEDTAAMFDGAITVVRAVEVVPAIVHLPAMHVCIGDVRPMKRAARDRLRPIVEGQGVVQRRRPHPVAHRRIGGVATGSGIDEQWDAVHAERQRQRVGVGVTAVLIPVRSAVDHQVIAAGRATRSSRCRAARQTRPLLIANS